MRIRLTDEMVPNDTPSRVSLFNGSQAVLNSHHKVKHSQIAMHDLTLVKMLDPEGWVDLEGQAGSHHFSVHL